MDLNSIREVIEWSRLILLSWQRRFFSPHFVDASRHTLRKTSHTTPTLCIFNNAL